MEFDPIAYINEPRWQESRLGLERIAELLDRMGRPQDRLKFVHVAGTNGKGSVCAYVERVLREAGYRTGLFTSPYIVQFEERIRVGGRNISLDDLREVTLFVRGHAEAAFAETGEHPTEFELMTAVAFEHFARSACDIVVCEVGLGGRLDSTNVIQSPEACVITRLGLDHTALLGDTLAQVAREKAGIVKAGAPVVSWPQEPEARVVIRKVAAAVGSTVLEPDFSQLTMGVIVGGARGFRYKGTAFGTRLLATYQPYNAALAIEVASVLRSRGWDVPDEAVERGIRETSWPGRFEIVTPRAHDGANDAVADDAAGAAQADVARVPECVDMPPGLGGAGDHARFDGYTEPESLPEPIIVVDGGHNPQGAQVLAESLRDAFPGERVTFVMSVLADKDYRSMVRAVAPLARAFVCVAPPNPRALSAADLAAAVREEARVQATACDTFAEAMEKARALAGPGVICAFGSLYSLAEIKAALG